jgi:CSLREA domain-containing protein
LPATITVTSLTDDVTPGDGKVSLREAINAINSANTPADPDTTAQNPGAFGVNDRIVFRAGLTGTIPLDSQRGQLTVSRPMTIQGLGAGDTCMNSNTCIVAGVNSRLFDIPATAGDVTLDGLTLTGGRTTGNNNPPSPGVPPDFTNDGGAIHWLSSGTLTVRNCTLSGNSTAGAFAGGGALFAEGGTVAVTNSTVSGNSTQTDTSRGGAVYADHAAVTLTDSTLSGNSTQGSNASGGAVFSAYGPVTVLNSTLSGNFTAGSDARGGGLFVRGPASGGPLAVTVTDSTLSGNYTQGASAAGGGMYLLRNATLTVTRSTVSGNFTLGARAFGGGMDLYGGTLTVRDSTISGNHTAGNNAAPGGGLFAGPRTVTALTDSTVAGNYTQGGASQGGGIATFGDVTLTNSTVAGNAARSSPGGGVACDGTLTLSSSIVAGNSAGGSTGIDIDDELGHLSVSNSLVGNGDGTNLTPGANGNLVGSAASPIDPLLGPLQYNGGPTQTRALLPGSPAIDRGANPLNLATDQRGFPFVRVFGAAPDVGAFEAQPLPTLVVTGAADRLDTTLDPTNLTLRDAVALADANRGGDSTITFAANLSGVPIRLSLGELLITEKLTVQGLGAANTTIDAQGQSRIFHILNQVTLDGLTLTGGRTTAGGTGVGGAIYSQAVAPLTIQDSVVSGNSTQGNSSAGGAIFLFGSGGVQLLGSTVTGNSTQGDGAGGGAIFSRGPVALTDSTVSGNSTRGNHAYGGGIALGPGSAGLTVSNSTISGNFTRGAVADGGGIYARNGATTLTDSTLSGNSAQGAGSNGGGLFSLYGPVVVNNSTVAGNSAAGTGGGLAARTTSPNNHYAVTLVSSIVAGNHDGGSNPDLLPPNASPLTVTSSLIGTNTGTGLAATGPTPDANGNLVGSAANPIGPMLGPLQNNGGATQTMALLPGSPAINRGSNPLNLATDQREAPFARVVGPQADMGAFEVQPLRLIAVNPVDRLDAAFDPTNLTLRDALALANANPGPDTITLGPALSGVPIRLSLGALPITGPVTIQGLGAANSVLDAQQKSRVFDVSVTAGDVTLDGLTLTGGRTTAAGDGGGAIRFQSHGTLTVRDCVISGNSTQGSESAGGGIYAIEPDAGARQVGGDVTVTDSTISGNSTAGFNAVGGGIFTNGGLTLDGSTVSGNSTQGRNAFGGGMWVPVGAAATLTNSTVAGNVTTGPNSDGAGIFVNGGAVTLANSTVSGNSAKGSPGGGLYAEGGGGVTLRSSIVAGNVATGSNPDLGAGTGPLTVTSSLIGNGQGTRLVPAGPTPDANGNLIGSATGPLDPRLGPLQDNGGPTPTMALLPDSPALGRGRNPLELATDQRGPGFLRGVGGAVDMGAFQTQAPVVLPPPNPTPSSLPPLPPVTGDVTRLTAVRPTGGRFNARSGRTTFQLLLLNTSGQALAGPVYLVFAHLPRRFRLLAPSGRTRAHARGSPFVAVPAGLGPHQSVAVTLTFRSAARRRVPPSALVAEVLAGPITV